MTSADSLIDRWLDLPGDSTERAAIEAELRRGPHGALLLDLARELAEGAPLGPDVASGIDRLLPAGSPALYRSIGDATLRAWQDPALRESLRRSPRETLASAGIELPASIEIVFVDPAGADRPTPHRVVLPLPPQGSPAVDEARAREALERTPFGVLIAPHPPGPLRGDRRGALTAVPELITAPARGEARLPWRSLAAIGLAAAAVALLVFGLPAAEGIPSGLSGAAFGSRSGAVVSVAAAALLLSLLLAAGVVRRRP